LRKIYKGHFIILKKIADSEESLLWIDILILLKLQNEM